MTDLLTDNEILDKIKGQPELAEKFMRVLSQNAVDGKQAQALMMEVKYFYDSMDKHIMCWDTAVGDAVGVAILFDGINIANICGAYANLSTGKWHLIHVTKADIPKCECAVQARPCRACALAKADWSELEPGERSWEEGWYLVFIPS